MICLHAYEMWLLKVPLFAAASCQSCVDLVLTRLSGGFPEAPSGTHSIDGHEAHRGIGVGIILLPVDSLKVGFLVRKAVLVSKVRTLC